MLRKIIVGVIVANFICILVSVITTFDFNFGINNIAMADKKIEVGATATVPNIEELDLRVWKTPWTTKTFNWANTSTEVKDINFGTLIEFKNETSKEFWYMGGTDWYTVTMVAATSGRKYQILVDAEPLHDSSSKYYIGTGDDGIDGSTEDAYLVVPDYQHLDELVKEKAQGAPPKDAEVGLIHRAKDTGNKLVYKSDGDGLGRIVRSYFAISGQPEKPLQNCKKGHNKETCVEPGEEFDEGKTWDIVTKNQPAATYSGKVTFTLDII